MPVLLWKSGCRRPGSPRPKAPLTRRRVHEAVLKAWGYAPDVRGAVWRSCSAKSARMTLPDRRSLWWITGFRLEDETTMLRYRS